MRISCGFLWENKMKIGFCLTIIPPSLYHLGEGGAKSELVIVEVSDEKLPQLIKDALDDSKEYVYIKDIVRMRE